MQNSKVRGCSIAAIGGVQSRVKTEISHRRGSDDRGCLVCGETDEGMNSQCHDRRRRSSQSDGPGTAESGSLHTAARAVPVDSYFVGRGWRSVRGVASPPPLGAGRRQLGRGSSEEKSAGMQVKSELSFSHYGR